MLQWYDLLYRLQNIPEIKLSETKAQFIHVKYKMEVRIGLNFGINDFSVGALPKIFRLHIVPKDYFPFCLEDYKILELLIMSNILKYV